MFFQNSFINKTIKSALFALFLLICLPVNSWALTFIEGVVYGGNSQLDDVTVFLVDPSTGFKHSGTVTRAGGAFRLAATEGTYRLSVISLPNSGYGSVNIYDVILDGTDKIMDVYLLPAGVTLSGVVYLPDGVTPASNIELKIFESSTPGNYIDSIVTDATGEYSFTVTAGTYGLHMKALTSNTDGSVNSLISSEYKNNIQLTDNLTKDITLPIITISGRTIDSNGMPVAGVEINVNDLNETSVNVGQVSQSISKVTSDVNGHYSLSLVPYSNYTITLVPPTSATWMSITPLKNMDFSVDASVHDLQLQQGRKLRGIVHLPNSDAAGDVQLKIFETSNPASYLDAITTDATGKYSFSLATGTYGLYIKVLKSSNAGLIGDFVSATYLDNIVLSHITNKIINMPFVTISGQTVDANGNPIAGVKVNVEGADLQTINAGQTHQAGGTVVSDQTGQYSFSLYPHSNYNVTLVPPANASGMSVTPLSNVDLSVTDSNHEFKLQTGHSISGVVYLPNGSTPASNVELKVFESGSPGVYLDSVTTDATGKYSFTMAAGSYGLYMKVLSSGNAEIINDFVSSNYLDNIILAQNVTQDITLPFVRIIGKTLDGNGVPVPGVELNLESAFLTGVNAGSISQHGGSLISDADGHYAYNTYPHSNYTISVSPPNGSGFATVSYSYIDLSADKMQAFALPFNDITPPLMVAGPYPRFVSNTSVLMEWQDSEPTIGTVTINGVSVSDDEYSTHHSIQMINLTPSSLTYVDISSIDRAGNTVENIRNTVFFTSSVADITAPVILSGPVVTAITDNTALIRWSTNEPTASSLSFGETTLSSSFSLENSTVDHELELTGLSPLTEYSVQVHATDIHNNGPVNSSIIQFQTIETPDTQAPVIVSGPLVSDVTDTGATIIWETNEPTTSDVSYNDGTAHNVYKNGEYRTRHEVRMTGLMPSTKYNFVVSLSDRSGNGPQLSNESSLITRSSADTLAPVLTEPLNVVGVTHRSALIHWRTDEPADSLIEYGLTADSLTLVESKSRLHSKHVIQLVNLQPNTEYHLKAHSTDAAGNELVTTVISITTRSLPDRSGPRFTESPRVIGLNNTAATIYWETDEPSDSVIKFGKGSSITHRRSSGHKTQKHQISITDLTPDEVYSYEVESRDSEGNLSTHSSHHHYANNQSVNDRSKPFFIKQAVAEQVSSTGLTTDAVADTTAPEYVIVPEIAAVSENYAILRWVTNEASNSYVEYGQTGANLDQLKAELEYATEHLMVLTNLTANTNYDVQIKASDLAGNQKTSDIVTFIAADNVDETLPNIVSDLQLSTVSATELVGSVDSDEYTIARMRCIDSANNSVIEVSSTGLKTSHRLYASNLDENADYSCEVSIQDIAGNIQQASPVHYTRTIVDDTSTTTTSIPNTDASVSTTDITPAVSADNNAGVSNGGSFNIWYLMICLLAFNLYRKHSKACL